MPIVRREMAAMDRTHRRVRRWRRSRRRRRAVVNERLIATLSTTLAVMATLLSVVGLTA